MGDRPPSDWKRVKVVLYSKRLYSATWLLYSMGVFAMFKRKDPQDLFGSTDFTVTNTIFEGPALSLLPSIFQDSQNRR